MTSTRRAAIVAISSLLAVTAGAAAAAAPPLTTAPPMVAAPRPVAPLEALRISEAAAEHAPPLPPGLAALISQRRSAEADGHPEGTGCDAQNHEHSRDYNADGVEQPWEIDPHGNETCENVVSPWSEGHVERRTETVTPELSALFGGLYDAEVGRTYTRVVGRSTSSSDGGHYHGEPCQPTQDQWDRAVAIAVETKAYLERYTNNPQLLLAEGYYPYPVPATKTFHWFKSEFYEDKDESGRAVILDPAKVEMMTMAMTDDGYRAVNTAWVWVYDGDGDPFAVDANDPAQWPNGDNAGTGCLTFWHGHTEGAEGAATFNTDGRTWMAHMWFYGGLYPFGDSDVDGSEPHGWWAPLNEVPALCNNEGGCI